jgi:triosephosphate isomerase
MRRPIIAANWKMHKNVSEAIAFARKLKAKTADVRDIDIVVCPPYTALESVGAVFRESNIYLGSQNMHWAEKGAFTGEIAAPMLRDLNVEYVILGHSERRQYFNETDDIVLKKLERAIDSKLLPILCVGETLEEREKGHTFDKVAVQLKHVFTNIPIEDFLKVTVAYEPIWAIGTGHTATPEQAEEVHRFIRDTVHRMFGEEGSESVRIQYGGSVKPENIRDLMAQPDIDGALVGGASLDPESFARLVKYNTVKG